MKRSSFYSLFILFLLIVESCSQNIPSEKNTVMDNLKDNKSPFYSNTDSGKIV